jgi:hypothetical protein
MITRLLPPLGYWLICGGKLSSFVTRAASYKNPWMPPGNGYVVLATETTNILADVLMTSTF